jgi:CDP-diacylglycerol--glycerol-3-phosphate 3-phosphatidyltransferase
MNLPNKLTVSRFVLTGALLAVIFSGVPFRETLSLLIFSAASFTDFLDGRIARGRKLITNFGILMDPLADKILICSVFIAFVGLRWMSAWMVVIIVARELAITGLRLLAATHNQVLAAEGFGKHKTISQIVAIIAIMFYHSYHEWGRVSEDVFGFQIGGHPWTEWVSTAAKIVAVVLTIVSGGLYLWRNRRLYLEDL